MNHSGGRPWRVAPLLTGSAAFHVAGLGVAAFEPGSWPAVTVALVANHCVILAGSLWPRSSWVGPTWTRLPDGAAARGDVALTFDDGPDPETTPRVLDILDRAGARATFFCVGRKVADFRALAGEIAARGHRVENHTWRHRHGFFFYGPARLRDEIERAQDAIERATGRRPRYFRAPAGIRSPWLEPALARSDLRLVAWTRRGYDTVVSDAASVARRLTSRLRGGDVLLLHDGSSARDASGRFVVLEALPRLLDSLAARSLRAVPFDAGAEPERGVVEERT